MNNRRASPSGGTSGSVAFPIRQSVPINTRLAEEFALPLDREKPYQRCGPRFSVGACVPATASALLGVRGRGLATTPCPDRCHVHPSQDGRSVLPGPAQAQSLANSREKSWGAAAAVQVRLSADAPTQACKLLLASPATAYLAKIFARRSGSGSMLTRARSPFTCGRASSRGSITRNHSAGTYESGNMPK